MDDDDLGSPSNPVQLPDTVITVPVPQSGASATAETIAGIVIVVALLWWVASLK